MGRIVSDKIKRNRKSVFPKAIRILLINFLIRIFGLLQFIVILGLAVALLSHNQLDPSWNVATSFSTKNIMGVTGAYISDILLQTIGYSSYLGLLIFSIRSLKTLFYGNILNRNNSFGFEISCGLLAIIPCSIFLADFTFSPLPNGAGGLLGNAILQIMNNYTLNLISFGVGPIQILNIVYFSITTVLFIFAVNIKFNRISSLLKKILKYIVKATWRTILWFSLNLMDLFVLIFKYSKKLIIKLLSFRNNKNKPVINKSNSFSQFLKIKSKNPDDGMPSLPKTDEHQESINNLFKVESTGDLINEEQHDEDSSEITNTVSDNTATTAIDIGKKIDIDDICKPVGIIERKEGEYYIPSLDLLEENNNKERVVDRKILQAGAIQLMKVLQEFGIGGEVSMIRPGPIITLYELLPRAGTKISRIISLSDDIARGMKALSVRIATVPGQDVIGFEIPNAEPQIVSLKELLESENYVDSKSLSLPLALGQDIGGRPVIVDLAKMPHLLVAGTTGSGKSVAINAMILSLLYRYTPDKCKLVLIDPKMLELSVYDKIPHLLSPVVTDPKKAIQVLHWAVSEMEKRYHKMSKVGVRNIISYNMRINSSEKSRNQNSPVAPIPSGKSSVNKSLPYIVIVVDEMADLMLVAGKEVEFAVQRLAQMARAAGIHIIMATQRPSVDVVTGTLKANFPSRISFQVASRIDSRTIINEQGAELLLGRGDMLFQSSGSRLTRLHSPFCSDEEVTAVADLLRSQGPPQYVEELTIEKSFSSVPTIAGDDEDEELYKQAVSIVLQEKRASTSYIQRRLKIGYNRAARLIEKMENDGYVGPADRVGRREVIM